MRTKRENKNVSNSSVMCFIFDQWIKNILDKDLISYCISAPDTVVSGSSGKIFCCYFLKKVNKSFKISQVFPPALMNWQLVHIIITQATNKKGTFSCQ